MARTSEPFSIAASFEITRRALPHSLPTSVGQGVRRGRGRCIIPKHHVYPKRKVALKWYINVAASFDFLDHPACSLPARSVCVCDCVSTTTYVGIPGRLRIKIIPQPPPAPPPPPQFSLLHTRSRSLARSLGSRDDRRRPSDDARGHVSFGAGGGEAAAK